ncbi:MAG: hypothetical protein OXT70_01135 [Chloroflexota bacterium]|nr:hypothetical protein [Chloroflexota bacterium]
MSSDRHQDVQNEYRSLTFSDVKRLADATGRQCNVVIVLVPEMARLVAERLMAMADGTADEAVLQVCGEHGSVVSLMMESSDICDHWDQALDLQRAKDN